MQAAGMKELHRSHTSMKRGSRSEKEEQGEKKEGIKEKVPDCFSSLYFAAAVGPFCIFTKTPMSLQQPHCSSAWFRSTQAQVNSKQMSPAKRASMLGRLDPVPQEAELQNR